MAAIPDSAQLDHMLVFPMLTRTKCGIPAPKMTPARAVLLEQGALALCPRCYPTPLEPAPRGHHHPGKVGRR